MGFFRKDALKGSFLAPYINNHNLKNLHTASIIRLFHLTISLSGIYKSGCLDLFCFWLFLVVPICFLYVSRFLLYVSGCFKSVLVVSRFLLYVHICLKGVPIYFNNVSIVSYMLKEYLKGVPGVPVVSKLFQGFSLYVSYMFF